MEKSCEKERHAAKRQKRIAADQAAADEVAWRAGYGHDHQEEDVELDDEKGEENDGGRKGPGSCKMAITQWVKHKWLDDLVGLKQVVSELGIQGMNYRSKRASIEKFVEQANRGWVVENQDSVN